MSNININTQIPFEIDAETPNETTRKAIDDVRNGIGLSKSFSSVNMLIEDLNADD